LSWGKFAPAIARWESVTRVAPPPVDTNTRGQLRLSARFSEWMLGWPDGWVTGVIDDVPWCRSETTITRIEAMKIIGNGVVPQQARAALQALKESVERKQEPSGLGVQQLLL
jgi:hypothetical protein